MEYLVEEAYETGRGDRGRPTGDADWPSAGELGDVLFQVVLHARLAEERGAFDFDDVAAA